MPFVKVNNSNLYFEDQGEGTPIVFVHGWTSSHWKWYNQVEYFKINYRVITLDLKGHGQSAKPHADYRISEFADELFEFLTQVLQGEKFILVGLSMGGMIVLTYASNPQYASNLLALIPCGTSYTMENPILSQLVQKLQIGELQFDRALREMLTKLGHDSKFARKNRELVQQEVEVSMQCPDHVAIACLDSFVNHYNIREDLRAIAAPTLLIAGEKDEMINPEISQTMLSLISEARLKIIGPNVGHCVHLEAPEEFNRTIEGFMEEIL